MSTVITAFSIKCEAHCAPDCAVNHAGRSGMAAEFNQTFELDGLYETPHKEIFTLMLLLLLFPNISCNCADCVLGDDSGGEYDLQQQFSFFNFIHFIICFTSSKLHRGVIGLLLILPGDIL